MRYRELGKTGLRVSELGYGAWGIGGAGWVGAEDDESLRPLERAIELGVNFLDTARGYGDSERLVGEVVRRHPGRELYGPCRGTMLMAEPQRLAPASGRDQFPDPAVAPVPDSRPSPRTRR